MEGGPPFPENLSGEGSSENVKWLHKEVLASDNGHSEAC